MIGHKSDPIEIEELLPEVAILGILVLALYGGYGNWDLDLATGAWLNKLIPGLKDQSCDRDMYGSVGRGHMGRIVLPVRTGWGIAATLDIFDQIILEGSMRRGFDPRSWQRGCWIQIQLNDLSLKGLRDSFQGGERFIPDKFKFTFEAKAHFQVLPLDLGFWNDPFKEDEKPPEPSTPPSGSPSVSTSPSSGPSKSPSVSTSPSGGPSESP